MGELDLKKRELALLKRKITLEQDLPHLYKKHYKWSRAFNDSINRFNCICAANQIGKSTAAIRKCIDDATNPKKWEILWPKLNGAAPDQIWYFYPDKSTLNREIQSKWIKWLPQGSMTIDPQYGWKLIKKSGDISGILFNTGVQVYFFTWTQDTSVIQASTVHEIFGDEEMPEKFYSELSLRLTRTNGIMNVVFTPTLNQEFWKDVIEGDVFPTAFKQQISMFDCIGYDDGSPSDFNEPLIQEVIRKCKNETEVQRRVFGKFIADGGRMFYAYESGKHLVERHDTPGWLMYAAVDSGSGGEKNHPAAIVFMAVKNDFTEARVVDAWRGDGLETTAGDLLNKYNELSRMYTIVGKVYDPSGVEFGLLAGRAGLGFQKAMKKREFGEETVNTLFKYDMLKLFDDNEEILKLNGELNHLMFGVRTGKAKAGDDLADALRYCVMQIPFNWENVDKIAKKDLEARDIIAAKPKTEKDFQAEQINLRRGLEPDGSQKQNEDDWTIEQELSFWDDLY